VSSADDRGSAAVLLLAVVVVVAGLGVVIGGTGVYLRATAQAAIAADAAALAAAPVTFLPFGATGSPRQEAGRFARANGATLLRCACPIDRSFAPREVVVAVRVRVSLLGLGRRSVDATSRARFDPSKLVSPSSFAGATSIP
jgi:secretion/DNA translocation related TadE-like protein